MALVGRPNVGKSALFNRLVGDESAIVSEEAGTTRDRHFGRVEWGGRTFWLVDTGGLPESSNVPMDAEIRKQVLEAIEEADLMLLVVDNKVGVHPSDHRVLDLLRDARKPWLLVANKVDDPTDPNFYEFYNMGAGDPHPVSANNGKQADPVFPAIVDTVMMALRYSQPNPAELTDPATNLTSSVYNTGEQMKYRTGVEATADERWLKRDPSGAR